MKTILFAILFLAVSAFTYGQRLSWQLAVGDRSATILPTNHLLDNKFYPVVQTGMEYTYLEKPRFTFGQTVKIHYSYHPILGNDMGIFSEATATFKIRNIFFIQTNLGLGYVGELPSSFTFRLNDEGKYEKVRSLLSMAAIPFSVTVGHEFPGGISPFVCYQYCILAPYNRTIDALPSDNLMLGVKVKLQKNARQ